MTWNAGSGLSRLLLLGLAASLASCGTAVTQQPATNSQSGSDPQTAYIPSDAKGVQTMIVKKAPISAFLDIPAHIEADPTRVVHVFPPAGGRIVEMQVRPWQQVVKGQTLALLESGDLARAVADYHKAMADSQVKDEELKRSEDLLAHHAIALKDFQQAQGDAASAQAELEDTRQQIQVYGMDPAHASTQLRLAAPRSGVILDVGAAPGEFSNALSAPQPLCTIADLTTVWAVGDIYEKDIGSTKIGGAAIVTLNAYPGEQWTGRVDGVSEAVDPNTRTLHVRVALPNSGTKLKPAMFGAIRLQLPPRQAILVPSSAVIREGQNAYVYVDAGNGHYQRRGVTLGETRGDSVEIASGIQSGDTVVTTGTLLLRDAG